MSFLFVNNTLAKLQLQSLQSKVENLENRQNIITYQSLINQQEYNESATNNRLYLSTTNAETGKTSKELLSYKGLKSLGYALTDEYGLDVDSNISSSELDKGIKNGTISIKDSSSSVVDWENSDLMSDELYENDDSLAKANYEYDSASIEKLNENIKEEIDSLNDQIDEIKDAMEQAQEKGYTGIDELEITENKDSHTKGLIYTLQNMANKAASYYNSLISTNNGASEEYENLESSINVEDGISEKEQKAIENYLSSYTLSTYANSKVSSKVEELSTQINGRMDYLSLEFESEDTLSCNQDITELISNLEYDTNNNLKQNLSEDLLNLMLEDPQQAQEILGDDVYEELMSAVTTSLNHPNSDTDATLDNILSSATNTYYEALENNLEFKDSEANSSSSVGSSDYNRLLTDITQCMYNSETISNTGELEELIQSIAEGYHLEYKGSITSEQLSQILESFKNITLSSDSDFEEILTKCISESNLSTKESDSSASAGNSNTNVFDEDSDLEYIINALNLDTDNDVQDNISVDLLNYLLEDPDKAQEILGEDSYNELISSINGYLSDVNADTEDSLTDSLSDSTDTYFESLLDDMDFSSYVPYPLKVLQLIDPDVSDIMEDIVIAIYQEGGISDENELQSIIESIAEDHNYDYNKTIDSDDYSQIIDLFNNLNPDNSSIFANSMYGIIGTDFSDNTNNTDSIDEVNETSSTSSTGNADNTDEVESTDNSNNVGNSDSTNNTDNSTTTVNYFDDASDIEYIINTLNLDPDNSDTDSLYIEVLNYVLENSDEAQEMFGSSTYTNLIDAINAYLNNINSEDDFTSILSEVSKIYSDNMSDSNNEVEATDSSSSVGSSDSTDEIETTDSSGSVGNSDSTDSTDSSDDSPTPILLPIGDAIKIDSTDEVETSDSSSSVGSSNSTNNNSSSNNSTVSDTATSESESTSSTGSTNSSNTTTSDDSTKIIINSSIDSTSSIGG